VDASVEMLKLAQRKMPSDSTVQFESCDAYNLEPLSGDFDAGLAVFWISHVPRGRLDDFLRQFHRKLRPGAVVVMADNMNVPGVGGEFVSSGGSADTCKVRELKDGSKHCVIKNYYDERELRSVLAGHSTNLETHFGKAHWWVRYRVAAGL
jgi:ubiquinone/menaquinone biosynthesis C-methylase UbiE